MAYDFKYVPTSGSLSGPAFISQTEQAVNEIGTSNEDARQLAEEAKDLAENVLTTSYEALGTAQQALTEAQKGKNAADQAMTAAEAAQRTADKAQADAASAQSTADSALSKANKAQQTADQAQVTAEDALATASLADSKAQIAQKTADKAQEGLDALTEDVTDLHGSVADNTMRINKMLVYQEPEEAKALDVYVQESLNLYIRDVKTLGLPEAVTGYLTVRVDDQEDMVTQRYQTMDGEIYSRVCRLSHEIPNDGLDRVVFSLMEGPDEISSGIFDATAENGSVNVDFKPGGFELLVDEETDEKETGANWGTNAFSGWVSLPLEGVMAADLSIAGQHVASLEEGEVTIHLDRLETERSVFSFQQMEVEGNRLRILLDYTWEDVEELITEWSDWKHLAIEWDETIIQDGQGRLSVAPYDLVRNLDKAAEVLIDKTTPASLSVIGESALGIRIADLGDACDKLTTLTISADSDLSVLWLYDGDDMMWISEEVVLNVSAGNTAIVTVWQVAGKCLLSTIYVDEPESLKLEIEVGDVDTFILYWLRKETCSADFKVNWGDGTGNSYQDLSETGSFDHVYAQAGKYTITIQASQASFSLRDNKALVRVEGSLPAPLSSQDIANMFNGCSNLISVDEDVFAAYVEAKNADNCFRNCKSLLEIPANIFANVSKMTSCSGAFYGCESLTRIPESLFANTPSLRLLGDLFYGCSSLVEIPEDLFKGIKFASHDKIFGKCTNLESIPPTLFHGQTELVTISSLFSGCTKLREIPGAMFKDSNSVDTVSAVFNGCISITDIPVDFFKGLENTRFLHGCFSGCNVRSVSEDLLKDMTELVQCTGLFSALEEVPEGLFRNQSKLTSIADMFSNCPLSTVPENLLAGLSELETVSRLFSGSGIKEIPEGFFKYSSKLTDIQACFSNCNRLREIPAKLFEGLKNVVRAVSIFDLCENLLEIPDGLFDDLENAEDFSRCFYSCETLTSVPSTLFDHAPMANTFINTFWGCTKIESAVPEIWLREEANGSGCYQSCVRALNYSDIPAAWK